MQKKDIQQELISVIIPIYNRAMVLNRAVDSILRQSYKNFELLLVDDGSEDESWSVCLKYAKIDTRIRVIRQEHSGVSCARNAGLIESRGEFIYFLDSDDVVSNFILYIQKNGYTDYFPMLRLAEQAAREGNITEAVNYIDSASKLYPLNNAWKDTRITVLLLS